MSALTAIRSLLLAWLTLISTVIHSADSNEIVLKDLRSRYQFQNIFLTESNLNNLTVHLRNKAIIQRLAKLGVGQPALNSFQGFLEDFAFERAFFQIDLQMIRAGYMLRSDVSPTIRHLAWAQQTVIEVALICDRYLQRQLTLETLRAKIEKGEIAVDSGWATLEQMRRDPYVPAVTLTETLDAYAKLVRSKPADLAALSRSNHGMYQQINTFITMANQSPKEFQAHIRQNVPADVRTTWVMRYLLLNGYWASTGELDKTAWLTQLDQLQQLELGPFRATWVPTSQALVDRMLEMARVSSSDYVVDLGSGDGRTVITAAKRGARALGIENNSDLVALSRRTAEKEGVSARTQFIHSNIFDSDFSQATVLTLYMLPRLNLKLRPAILNLKPGTRVVSGVFTMDDWKPDQTASVGGDHAYLWIVPARVEGTWKVPEGELALTQRFQELSGTLKSGGIASVISNGKLRGDQISFTVGDTEYTGRIIENVMYGSARSKESVSAWKATRLND